MAELLLDYWTSFIRAGNPNTHGCPKWNAFSHSGRAYMAIRDGRAEPGCRLRPGVYELNEKIINRRRDANKAWMLDVGLLAPVLGNGLKNTDIGG